VSLSWVKGVVRRRRETGNCHALAHGGGQRATLNAAQRNELSEHVTANRDALLRELQAWLETEQRVHLSLSSFSRLLAGMNLPRKKTLHATERDSPANQQKREAWRRQVEALAAARLVFVDESGVTRSMTRRDGRARPDERVAGAVPLGHWEMTTLIGALARHGVCASFSLDAATDQDVFQVFVE
jgi:transposase